MMGRDLIAQALRFGVNKPYRAPARTVAKIGRLARAGNSASRMGRRAGRATVGAAHFVNSHPYAVGIGVGALGFGVGASKGLGSYAKNSFWGQNAGPIARSTAASQLYGYGGSRMSQTMNGMR